MVQRIKHNQVKVVTKDGECEININLEISINLNADGLVIGSEAKVKKVEQEDEDVKWAIPDFGAIKTEKVDFGKQIKGE